MFYMARTVWQSQVISIFLNFLMIGVDMKTLTSALMISAAVFVGTAYAADSSPITRAQVIAEMQQARAAGLISNGEEAYPPAVRTTSTESRSEVKAELAAAIAAGQVSKGEEDYPPVAATGSAKSHS